MLVLFIGDSHGNLAFMRRACEIATEAQVDMAIQVGDFGFGSFEYGSDYPHLVHKTFKKAGLPLGVIKGNHDDPRKAAGWMNGKLYEPGLTVIPNASVEMFGEVRVGFMGGAVSVDQGTRTENLDWWSNEVPTDEEFDLAADNGPVDVWVTHDCPQIPPGKEPWSFGPNIDNQCAVQRQKMFRLRDQLKPSLHIHGHWHQRYTADYAYGRVIGLHCESKSALLLVEFTDKITVGW